MVVVCLLVSGHLTYRVYDRTQDYSVPKTYIRMWVVRSARVSEPSLFVMASGERPDRQSGDN